MINDKRKEENILHLTLNAYTLKLHYNVRSTTSRLVAVVILFSSQLIRFFAGGHRGVVIPVPIPNTEVKGSIAEGSAGLARARVGRRRLFLCLRITRRHKNVSPDSLDSPDWETAVKRSFVSQWFFNQRVTGIR